MPTIAKSSFPAMRRQRQPRSAIIPEGTSFSRHTIDNSSPVRVIEKNGPPVAHSGIAASEGSWAIAKVSGKLTSVNEFMGAARVPIHQVTSSVAINAKNPALPVFDSCDGCGACCLVVTQPPFYRIFDEAGEDAWERLKGERPDLVAELIADYQKRRVVGGPFYGTPCVWFDETTRRCRHYEFRPRACRQFEIGSRDCHDARRRAGIS
jgi:hypothetical protein